MRGGETKMKQQMVHLLPPHLIGRFGASGFFFARSFRVRGPLYDSFSFAKRLFSFLARPSQYALSCFDRLRHSAATVSTNPAFESKVRIAWEKSQSRLSHKKNMGSATSTCITVYSRLFGYSFALRLREAHERGLRGRRAIGAGS